ncbi:MAG: hypothetical protein JWN95_731 [Frankiales bacterium]|nr:hypothetical protein [Frankiales bacterium]
MSIVQYPVLAILSRDYFMEHFREVYGSESSVVEAFVEDSPIVAAKLVDEVDALCSRYDIAGLNAELDSQGIYVGDLPNELQTSAQEWIGWVRSRVAELIGQDPPNRFDYFPFIDPKHEPDLGALKVIMGRVNQPRRENSRDGIVAAVQGAALAFFGDIGEFYWEIELLLELSEEEIQEKFAELEIPFDATRIAMARREFLELALKTVREIGAPPSWLA